MGEGDVFLIPQMLWPSCMSLTPTPSIDFLTGPTKCSTRFNFIHTVRKTVLLLTCYVLVWAVWAVCMQNIGIKTSGLLRGIYQSRRWGLQTPWWKSAAPGWEEVAANFWEAVGTADRLWRWLGGRSGTCYLLQPVLGKDCEDVPQPDGTPCGKARGQQASMA